VAFSAPNVQFLQGTSTHSLGILSPATVAKSDDECCAGVIGSGPFTVASYTKNESIVLAKRAGHDWVRRSGSTPGTPTWTPSSSGSSRIQLHDTWKSAS
jgi:peptide/nickel transport system substrate-binding protein